ncbi:MAG: hypothetical protein NT096_00025 [Proteobacteria bacterium]|nr:hypothetical protein [Pseudomonadota bacterium]
MKSIPIATTAEKVALSLIAIEADFLSHRQLSKTIQKQPQIAA